MTLFKFCRTQTQVKELCVIRDEGYIIATAWIDYEDLFRLPESISNCEVIDDEWDFIPIVNENGCKIYIPCHYIDIDR